MASSPKPNPRKFIKLTNPENLYDIQDETGNQVSYEDADGRQLFNHYRHNMTNYDQVLDAVHDQQGHVTGKQQKQATAGAAEQILEKYRDEHVKVIQDSQKKGSILKGLMQRAGVGTAKALTDILDSASEKVKNIAQLENSQRSLQTWNDTYRVQRELVKKTLKEDNVSAKTIAKVNKIYSTRSTNKAVELGMTLFDLEKSEILKLVKTAIRYKQLQ